MKTKIIKNKIVTACKIIRPLMAKDLLSDFSGIRVDAAGPNVSLTGGNSVIQVEYRMLGETEEAGSEIVNGAFFDRFVAAMPEGEIAFETKNNKLHIKGGAGILFKVSRSESQGFVGCVGIGGEPVVKFPIPALTLREMFRKVVYAAGRDATRANLTGIALQYSDGAVHMVATDGKRLSCVQRDVELTGGTGDSFDVILPRQTVETLRKMLGDGGDVDVQVGSAGARFVTADWSVTSAYVAGEYPAWRQVLPKDDIHVAKIDRVALADAISRAAAATAGMELPKVQIVLTDGEILLSAKGDIASANISIPDCHISAADVEMKAPFNPALLLDALGCVDDDEIEWRFGNPHNVATISCSLPWMAVVMPLREC